MPTSPEGFNPSNIENPLAYTEAEKDEQENLGYLKRFQRVNVLRKRSGQMDSDWWITGYNNETGRVVVAKGDDPNKTSLFREYKREELEEWNPK